MKKVLSSIENIRIALRLLFKVAPMYLFYTVALGALMGLMSPIHLWNWQKLIDSITASLTESNLDYRVLVYLGFSGLIALFSIFLQRIDQYVAHIFANKMEYSISKHILLIASEFSMEQYDDPETYDKISMLIWFDLREIGGMIDHPDFFLWHNTVSIQADYSRTFAHLTIATLYLCLNRSDR